MERNPSNLLSHKMLALPFILYIYIGVYSTHHFSSSYFRSCLLVRSRSHNSLFFMHTLEYLFIITIDQGIMHRHDSMAFQSLWFSWHCIHVVRRVVVKDASQK